MSTLKTQVGHHNIESDDAFLTSSICTMLQKFSKCEVKAARYGHFSKLLPLRFYVKSNFGELKRSKNVIFANFRVSEL